MKHQIGVSESAWRYMREIKRKYRTLHNNKNLEYDIIVDEMIEKLKKCEDKNTSVTHTRRNLKPPVSPLASRTKDVNND